MSLIPSFGTEPEPEFQEEYQTKLNRHVQGDVNTDGIPMPSEKLSQAHNLKLDIWSQVVRPPFLVRIILKFLVVHSSFH